MPRQVTDDGTIISDDVRLGQRKNFNQFHCHCCHYIGTTPRPDQTASQSACQAVARVSSSVFAAAVLEKRVIIHKLSSSNELE